MIKVSEATPSQINYLVAKIEGVKFTLAQVYGLWSVVTDNYKLYEPATDWSQGGPIIEREKICIGYRYVAGRGLQVHAYRATSLDDAGDCITKGLTPLIAAMRCYLASKLGDTVDVPEELINV